MGGKHRLKRHDLVKSLFFLFSQEYDSRKDESILDIQIPTNQVIKYLQERFSVSYSGNNWIFTQIRNYEEEIGYRLFQKEKNGDGGFSLRLYTKMEAFEQKRHLYVSQKIKVCNALFDMISNTVEVPGKKKTVKLFLGAGSTVFHLAQLLAEKDMSLPFSLEIYSHNISVINCFLSSRVDPEHIKVRIPGGDLDPVTNSIISPSMNPYGDTDFDYIIQGTSYLTDGAVYVESHLETELKKSILHKSRGQKVLILTGHEVRPQLPIETPPFGRLLDYDFLVIPHNRNRILKNLDQMLVDFRKYIEARDSELELPDLSD